MGFIEQLVDRRVYLDTNIFIYILEGSQQYQETLGAILEAVENKQIECYSSELTLAEALVIPFKKGRSEHISQYSQLLQDERFVSLVLTSREIYIKAAFYRAELNLALPDSIHVASALAAECDVFLTNDRRLKVPKPLTLLHLE